MSLEELSLKYKILKDKTKEIKTHLSDVNKDLAKIEKSLLEEMETSGLDSFKNESGSFSKAIRTSVKLPSSPEAWSSFWQHLKDKGHYDAMKTVNSQKLNGWYKEELGIAKEEGNFDFSVPGLLEPTITEYISMRKV